MFRTTKYKIIAIIIFTIICITMTILLIMYKNIETEEIGSTEESTQENVETISGIDLYGKYNQNDLIIEEKSYSTEKAEVKYIQIAGLKDKTIQNKINSQLEEYGMKFYKEKIDDISQITTLTATMSLWANYSNTISIYIYEYLENNTGTIEENVECLNYDLTTGEQITIDKMFTETAPINTILRKAAYNELLGVGEVTINLAGEVVVEDYGDMEDEIFEFIYKYEKGEINKFYFTPQYIYIIYEEYSISTAISIEMEEFAEYIAIYNRYLTTDSIFETNNIGMKNLYTLSERESGNYYVNYQNEKNYLIDVTINYNDDSVEYEEFDKEIIEEKIDEIEAEIEKIKTLSDRNSDKYYILNYYINIEEEKDSETNQNILTYYEYGNTYVTTVDIFESSLEDIIIEYNRVMGEYVYDFSEVLNEEPQTLYEIYNPITGEKTVI